MQKVFTTTTGFVSSESKKPPKGRILRAACNLTFWGSGHRDARPAHGITGRRQSPVWVLCSMGEVNNQPPPGAACSWKPARAVDLSRFFASTAASSIPPNILRSDVSNQLRKRQPELSGKHVHYGQSRLTVLCFQKRNVAHRKIRAKRQLFL